MFVGELERRVDENHVYMHCSNLVNRWLALNLNLVNTLILVCAALCGVAGKRYSIPASFVGLSLSYAMRVTHSFLISHSIHINYYFNKKISSK